jgi:peptide/nickel transport system substrate-binding protein
MRVAILGPLGVTSDGREGPIGAAKQRALLVLLVLRRGRLVPAETLEDELWAGSPPATANKVIHAYVSQLRKALGDGVIETHPGGYLLRLGPDDLDADRFEALLARGRESLQAGDPRAARSALTEALDLWRGPALGEFRYDDFAADEVRRLDELRLVALELRAEVDLELGSRTVVADLEPLVREHPTRESLLRLHLVALYRSGRQAEALAAYDAYRATLADELGLDPSDELQRLQGAILRHDPSLDPPSAVEPETSAPAVPAPAPASPVPAPVGRQRRRVRRRVAVAVVSAVAATSVLVLVRGGGARETEAGDSIRLFDVHARKVSDVVRVHGAPTAVAVGDGSVWAVDAEGGTVSRIDPSRHTVVQTIPVGFHPSGVAVGPGSVWVTNHDDGTVSWISPAANRVVRTVTVGTGPVAVAVGFGSVWVTNVDDRTLSRLDASTGAVVATVRTQAASRGVAVGGGMVWVTDEASRSVLQVDPRTNRVRGSASVGTGAAGVAYGRGAVWVTNSLDDTVTRVDATTLTTTVVTAVPGGPSAVAATDDAVWVVSEFAAQLVQLDPRSGSTVRTTTLGERPTGVATGAGGVWITVQASGNGHRGGRLTVVGASLVSIDPALLAGDPSEIGPLYDGLTALRSGAGVAVTDAVPDLAVALPRPTDGGRTYRFRLRPGMRYSDGRPVVAADFRRSLERALRLDAPAAQFFGHLEGAAACQARRRCDLSRAVVSESSLDLTIRLPEPDPRLLLELTQVFPVPEGTALDHDVGRHAVPGTGPYVVASFVPHRELVLERNLRFRVWSAAARPDGYPDQIVLRAQPNQDAAVRQVASGSADVYVADHTSPEVERFLVSHPTQVHLFPHPALVFAFLNVSRPPFDDLRVRQAVNLAVDRAAVVRLNGEAFARVSCQVVPPALPGYQPYCPWTVSPDRSGRWTAPDLARARRLIRDSGAAGSAVEVWVFANYRSAGSYMVSLLNDLGFRARTHYVADVDAYFDALSRTPSVQAGIFGWFGLQVAADQLTGLRCGYAFNPAHYCDHGFDNKVEQLLREEPVDPSGTAPLAAALDRQVTDAAPWVPLFTPLSADLTSSRVGNLQHLSVVGFLPLVDRLWVR